MSQTVRVRYSAGEWLGLVRGRCLVALPADASEETAAVTWDLLAGTPGVERLLATVLSGRLDLTGLPSFAIVSFREGTSVHAILRGEVTLRMRTTEGAQAELHGTGVATWNERLFRDIESFELLVEGAVADVENLPLETGGVRLGSLFADLGQDRRDSQDSRDSRDHGDSARADAAPAPAPVPEPEPEPETAAEPEPVQQPGAAAVVADAPMPDAAAGQESDVDGETAADVEPEPAAGEDSTGDVADASGDDPPEGLNDDSAEGPDEESNDPSDADSGDSTDDDPVDGPGDEDPDEDVEDPDGAEATAAEAASTEVTDQDATMVPAETAAPATVEESETRAEDAGTSDAGTTDVEGSDTEASDSEASGTGGEDVDEETIVSPTASAGAAGSEPGPAAQASPAPAVPGPQELIDSVPWLAAARRPAADPTPAPESRDPELLEVPADLNMTVAPETAFDDSDGSDGPDGSDGAAAPGETDASVAGPPSGPAGNAVDSAVDADEADDADTVLSPSAPGGAPTPAVPADEDHDGETVMKSDLNLSGVPETAAQPAPTPPPATGPVVLARQCSNGHANPPTNSTCGVCGQSLSGEAQQVRRPSLGRIRMSSGEVVELDRPAVVGRQPQAHRVGSGAMPRMVQVRSPNGDISRSHCEVVLEGWHVQLHDLKATNGTVLIREGQPPRRLSQGESIMVLDGDIADLGDGVSLRFEGLL